VLWQYCSCYSVTLHFHITATRVGNVLHIELFIREGYTGDMLESTNRVRKFYQVHPRSDVLCADGCTVDTSRALSCQPGRSTRVFSWKQLTNLDLTSASLVLPTPLGRYLQEPHTSHTSGWHPPMARTSINSSPMATILSPLPPLAP
jgi:hypothetical protein